MYFAESVYTIINLHVQLKQDLGGISSSVLSVFFTDKFYIKATEILASDWLRENLSVKNTDKMLDEMPP